MNFSEHPKIDPFRYRKIRRFFLRVFFRTFFWDYLLTFPVVRLFRTPPLPRWQEIARQYRQLAVEMRGVLIKLGQFLSIRVDILPIEITNELAELQDEAPSEKVEDIIARIEQDFSRPISDIFKSFDPHPLGSASLAQVHRVILKTGEDAVVKVFRPGIHVLVETDLQAIALAFQWLKFFRKIRQRVNLDWLADEFRTVTKRELDVMAEGRAAERFQKDFEGNPHVYIPKIYWEYCRANTLTMENVGYIKITDLEAIDAAGIQRAEVADILYRIYMRQVFETNFVHVDPHPGNLFIKPLRDSEEIASGVPPFKPNDFVPFKQGRPFQIAFVDFGMYAIVPDRLRTALREYVIAFGTRDAYKMVQSYLHAGSLLEGADLRRLEEAHESLFQRFWGLRVGQIKTVAEKDIRQFIHDYRDVIYSAPFQFQADMLFIVRAIGILSGIAAKLDPDFDLWSKTIPFAKKFTQEELSIKWEDKLQEAMAFGQDILNLPSQLDQVLTLAKRGKLSVQASFSSDTRNLLRNIEKSLNRLGWIITGATFLISGVLFQINGSSGTLWITGSILAFLVGIWKK